MGRPKGSKNKISKKLKRFCQICGKEFEIYPYRSNEAKYCSLQCRPQHFKRGQKSYNYKNGRYKSTQGYILILKPNHPFPNHPDGYIHEHRFIVEQQIGRYLLPTEHCHHINKIKIDNRPENLMAFNSNSAHKRFEKNNQIKSSEIIFDGRKL